MEIDRVRITGIVTPLVPPFRAKEIFLTFSFFPGGNLTTSRVTSYEENNKGMHPGI